MRLDADDEDDVTSCASSSHFANRTPRSYEFDDDDLPLHPHLTERQTMHELDFDDLATSKPSRRWPPADKPLRAGGERKDGDGRGGSQLPRMPRNVLRAAPELTEGSALEPISMTTSSGSDIGNSTGASRSTITMRFRQRRNQLSLAGRGWMHTPARRAASETRRECCPLASGGVKAFLSISAAAITALLVLAVQAWFDGTHPRTPIFSGGEMERPPSPPPKHPESLPAAPPLGPASPPLGPALSPPIPSHPEAGYVAGCRSPWPRASFIARTSCALSGEAACRICGSTSACTSISTPSGMQFPRHNVPQYTGNSVWDGPIHDLESAIRAMLGDPFAFAMSPEMDALQRLFSRKSTSDILRDLGHRWHDEPRYPAYEMSRGSRNAFLGAMSHLSVDYIVGHRTWPYVIPESMRQRVEASLRSSTLSLPISGPAATCAAAIVMDGIFASRSNSDIWVTSLAATGATSRNAEADPHTLLRELYVIDAGGSSVEVDPSGDIFTTPYQTNANGYSQEFPCQRQYLTFRDQAMSAASCFQCAPSHSHRFYAGNLSFVFKPSDFGGSGIDAQYVASQLCPGPPPVGHNESAWQGEWCAARERDGVLEFARSNGDAGEMRTPGYKLPGEVVGAMIVPWGALPSPWGPAYAFDFDLSTLMRPIEWAFFRSTEGTPDVVLVLAPGVVQQGVYGILPRTGALPPLQRFVAMKAPPESMGGPRADERIAPGVPFFTLDRAPPESPDVNVPVWGALYRCSTSNLVGAQNGTPPPPMTSARDRAAMCTAKSVVRSHVQLMQSEIKHVVEQTLLPPNVVDQLVDSRLWPAEATVDLAISNDVISPAPPDEICVLSVAALRLNSVHDTCDS